MRFNKGLTGFLSATCVLLATQVSVSANPFGELLNTVNNVNRNVNYLDRTINGTAYTINSLSDTLGLNLGSDGNSVEADASDPTGQVLEVYQLWYEELPASEQETVSWLVMEHARDQDVTFDTVSSSDWFLQKPAAEQSHVAASFFKLQNIIEATAQDRSRFLAFAFCVNGGGSSCE
ncbi:MAG: hypothetical protein WBB01_22600 [Phormidesmis sp.]